MSRRAFLALSASAFAASLASAAFAFEAKTFILKDFEDAQAKNQSIVVEVGAPWCPTCKVQAPILMSLAGKPEYKDVVFFKLDFDTQKDALRALGARQQSTLIAYKGKAQTMRSIGETRPESIEELVRSAL